MESAEMVSKKIEELIEDEDKIVTIPYLAVTLHVSIQTSQNLVKQYVENKTKSQEITVTYVLRGFLKNGKRKGIFIVEDSNLQVKRELFEKVEDELIFSIQKNKNVDFDIISLVDKIDSTRGNGPLEGSIVGNSCLKREKVKKPSVSPVSKTSSTFASASKSAEKNKEICSKSEPDSKTADLPSQMVALVIQKDTLKNKSTNKENKPKKGKSGISNFFKTVSSKNASDSKSLGQGVEGTSKTEDNIEEIESGGCDKIEDSASFMEVQEETDESEKNQQIVAAKSKLVEKTTKRRREENVHKNTKKRKRIVERNDSESDDMFEKIPDEDIIDKSDDEPEPVPSHVKNPLEPKNRRRKAVDKTYQDSEGFIVTKTEYIYETASEEENEITVENKGEKPEIKPLDKKKIENSISPRKSAKEKKEKKNNKQNQPTLMNFFKKK